MSQPNWAQRLDDRAEAWLHRRFGITAGTELTKRQKVWFVVTGAALILLFLVVAFLSSESPRILLGKLVLDATIGAFGVGLFLFLKRRHVARLWRQGSVECALRVLEGEVEGLGAKWHRGTAGLSRHRMRFQPNMTARAWRPPPLIHLSLGPDAVLGRRPPKSGELVNAGMTVFELRTDTAIVEWAVPSRQAEAALERLTSDEVPGQPHPTGLDRFLRRG